MRFVITFFKCADAEMIKEVFGVYTEDEVFEKYTEERIKILCQDYIRRSYENLVS